MDNHSKSLDPFPDLSRATEDGLLAMGGDLSPERLLLAYQSGIFPWFNPGDPILWWSPDPRCVLFPDQFQVSRSLQKSLRNRGYTVTRDTAFERVIEACSGERNNQPGTKITGEMKSAYLELHHLGIAHSVETWLDEELIGGLYGLALGSIFFGESMFSTQNDASKVSLATMVEWFKQWEFPMIDCQVTSPHLMSLGATEIPRAEFMEGLKSGLFENTKSKWDSSSTTRISGQPIKS